MPIQLQEHEKLVDKWTVHYHAPTGTKYNGVLYLTNKSLYFEGNFEIQNMRVEAVDGGFVIPLEDIKDILTRKSNFIFNQLAIDLHDGSRHIFDRGIMSTMVVKNLISNTYIQFKTSQGL